MNRRRMMIAQQNKGFELVYDAASGLLPTECGWEILSGNPNGMVLENGVCKFSPKDNLTIAPINRKNGTNRSLEVEFYFTGIYQAVSVDNGVTMFASTTPAYGVVVCRIWGEWLYQSATVPYNKIQTMKTIREGQTINCYLNDGHILGSTFDYDFSNAKPRVNVNNSTCYIRKITYKEW